MAKQEQASKRPQRARASLFTKVLILVLVAAMGWQLHRLQEQVSAAQAEKEVLAAQVQAQQQENDALSADIAEGSTQEKMEDMARHELGMVYPNERVFSNISN